MNNILFYYDKYCGALSHGGTEVATSRIAMALKSTGKWEIFNACKRRQDSLDEELYKEVKVLPNPKNFVRELSRFIEENNIDVVVNMGRFYRHPKLKRSIEKSGRKVKLVFMHHFAPGSESKKHTYKAGWHLLRLDPFNYHYWSRGTVFPLLKLQRKLCLSRMYRRILEESVGVVLLSEGYRNQYLEKAYGSERRVPEKASKKFFAIPDIYELQHDLTSTKKEKRVLILSRMDEIQKRISLALKIWKLIEEDEELADWKLDIVGSGNDGKALGKMARKLNLQRVVFHGWSDPIPFLERSQILMTTSDYEGLSLAMIEAQTFGCVPVAYNSYASVGDIIKDGITGVLVENLGDVEAYFTRLSKLMKEEENRAGMAERGLAVASSFSSDKVAGKWLEMLEYIMQH